MADKKLNIGNLKRDPHSTTVGIDSATTSASTPTETKNKKKKIGRPKIKEGEYRTVNISVPVHILEQMEVAKLKYGNNLTAYVNSIIKADLDNNYDNYLELQKLINS